MPPPTEKPGQCRVTVNEQGHFIGWNKTIGDILDYSAADFAKRSITQVVAEEAAPALQAAIFSLALKAPPAPGGETESSSNYEEKLTAAILSKDGTPHMMHLTLVPQWSLFKGAAERAAVQVRERERKKEALLRSKAAAGDLCDRWRFVKEVPHICYAFCAQGNVSLVMNVSESEGAVITIAGNGNISSCNQAACDMFGCDADSTLLVS